MSKRCSLLLAVWLFASTASAQTTVDLTLDEAGVVATQALLAGDTQLAFTIADAVLAQQPDNRQALLVMAAAAPRLGDPARGRQAGARAFALSNEDIQRYEAARLTALAAAAEERFTLATFWLRRALNNAPNEAERERTITDARNVSRRDPLSLRFSASIVPSNNVNGGAEDAESTAPGNPTGTLSEDALALEGWRASLNLGASYRFQENPQSRSIAGINYQLGRVRITEDTNVPDEAFDTAYYEFFLRHDRVLENGTVSFNGSLGTYEYRDLDLGDATTEFEKYDIWRLGISRQLPISDRDVLSFSGTREWLTYSTPGIGEVDRWIWRAGISRGLENGDRISGNLTLTFSEGDSVNFNSNEQTLSVNYGWAEQFGPVSFAAGGGVKWSDFPDYRLLLPVDGGRQDTTYFLNANVGFPDIEYFGFTPGLRIEVSEADSNVSRFDRTNYSVGLTLSSVF
ncbi:MAG: surface lipoprotein assembly modifier [Pseudomonadota bacterium]